MSDMIFDGVLEKAFNEYADNILTTYPSDEEMKNMYPISEKQKKMYERIARVNKRGRGERIKLLDFVACSFAGQDMSDKHTSRKSVKILKRAAIAAIIIILLVGTVIAVSEPVRELIKFSIKRDDKSIGYSADWSPIPREKHDYNYYTIGYIPERFELSSDEVWASGREIMYDADGYYIYIGIYDFDSTSTYVSPNYSYYTVKMIRGRESHIYYYDSENSGVILMFEENVGINVSGYASLEELLKIAENIK